ncbi:MAG TPA: hypothetical protein VGR35_10090 [Tepidisphaeraceae bacterium]|nr:hypothetical protein [Tepidisphaeraceae bacterium]
MVAIAIPKYSKAEKGPKPWQDVLEAPSTQSITASHPPQAALAWRSERAAV